MACHDLVIGHCRELGRAVGALDGVVVDCAARGAQCSGERGRRMHNSEFNP